ncbi:MAG TPA: bacterial transcriptional activator domain-containing protein [Thermoanaerobaculia bacterium]
MSEPFHLFPQLDRLVDRIESLDAPFVQLWGWPGSGKTTVLEALLARHAGRGLALPLAALAEEATLRQTLETAGVRWFVVAGRPEEGRLAAAERWLRPGQRLVFAAERRGRSQAVSGEAVPPQELLLTAAEVAALGHLITGEHLAPEAAQSLWQATDGWYRPLRLAFEATGGLGLEDAGTEAILEIPAVRLFCRHEVLDAFAEEERSLLLEAQEERPASGGKGAWNLIDERGLWIEGPERDRLPRLLAAALGRERRRRRSARPASSAAAPASAESRLVYKLGLLGSPLVRQRDESGERDLNCRLRRSLQVLAFLASSPGLQAGREELVEAVWPTEGERTIERNFHPTLSHLRRALEGGQRSKDRPAPLLFRGGIYQLNPEVMWEIDALDLGRLVEEGRGQEKRGELAAAVETWRRAWKLYRGPFLQGHYEAWIASRRESYQRHYLDMLRDLGDLYIRLGQPEEAMDIYRTSLIEDPLQERIHLAVMRLYAQQGRRDLVRRQYDNLCRILLKELGEEPMPETTRDYHRLMA